MSVVGVTGTNGKSTCAVLLQHVHTYIGNTCGLVGGIDTFDGKQTRSAALTTPPASELAMLLAAMRHNGCSHVAMEASSQGIATHRLTGVRLSAGIFTNLSGDHLDLHGDLDTYAAIKRGWMAALPSGATRVVNIDDACGAEMASRIGGPVVTCGAHGQASVEVVQASLDGLHLNLRTPWGCAETSVPLVGRHNAMNVLQVAVAHCAGGGSLDEAAQALETAPTPRGRLQRVVGVDGGPTVFVDFAHTVGALEAVLSSIRALVPEGGRLVLVFGCGGDRDRTKRPRMAAIATRWADAIWLTSDNPRMEDPEAILDHIEEGFLASKQTHVHREADRAKAIGAAVTSAAPNDVVVIAGKGHERVQLIMGAALPFDDMVVARAALEGARQ
jgi:UDP-N-acetylmuramoyl-L-alanyl-D-glutamate--2,6-diaminopimelate ligase